MYNISIIKIIVMCLYVTILYLCLLKPGNQFQFTLISKLIFDLLCSIHYEIHKTGGTLPVGTEDPIPDIFSHA